MLVSNMIVLIANLFTQVNEIFRKASSGDFEKTDLVSTVEHKWVSRLAVLHAYC